MADSLYLVDAYSLIFQVFHALPEMTSPSGLPTNALFGFTKDMMFLRNEKKPAYLVVCFDAPGKTFRDEIFEEYKAHRGPMPDDLSLQIPLIKEMLAAMRIPLVAQEGYEADDLIATLAHAGEERGMDVFICSSDKDCRQLLTERVKIFSLRKREIFDAAALQTDWGIRPEQVIDYQALVGDSVDNVPGADGVGPKTASAFLQSYGNIENLLAHIDEIKGKKKESLQAFASKVELSRKLVTLDKHVPIAFDWPNWTVQPWNGPKLLELYRAWGFRALADQVRNTIKDAPVRPTSGIVQGSLFGDDELVASNAIRRADWPHEYHLVNTPKDFAAFLDQLKKQKRFAIDLETSSLEPHRAIIVGIAISWKAGEAWYLAIRGPANAETLDQDQTLAQLKPILEDASIGKLNQNIKYDWQVLRTNEICMAGIVGDSMIADYLLHAGTRTHNLDILAMDHLGHRNIAIAELIGTGRNQLRMDQVPLSRITEYAGEDADVAWRLCEKLELTLIERGFKRQTAREGEPREGKGREGEAPAEPCATPNHGSAGASPSHRSAAPSQPGASPSQASPENYLYDDIEIPLIEVLAEMEYHGIRLDVPLLKNISKEMDASLAELEKATYAAAGREFNINSVPQMREILFTHLKFKPIKRTDIGGESSTDQETLEALAMEDHPHVEFPRRLLEHRKISKLKGTYVDALPALVNPRTGRVHTSFNQTVASTGRLSSSEPNLQNLPIRSEMGGNIRRAFIPEAGWQLLTADYSQIELRLLAHFSGDTALQKAFAEDRDIHALVASEIFDVEQNHVTDAMRRAAKVVNFGIIYGMSPGGLARGLDISLPEAGKFIDAYFARYPSVHEYQDNLLKNCREKGFVQTILGRRRQIEGVRYKTSYRSRNQPEREAINMQIQGSAADLIKVAMLAIQRRIKREKLHSRMLLQIHDELVFEVAPKEERATVQLVHEEMTQALADRLNVPLRVDMSMGANWHDAAEVNANSP